MMTLAAPLAAQEPRQPLRIIPPTADAPSQNKASRQKELDKVRAEQKKAAESQARLKAEIEVLGQDRRKLSRALIETATRLREAEERAAASETRLAALDRQESEARKALRGKRAVVAELLAALQRMGRSPPPALLVRPQDALDAVRSAIMLGAVLPEMRSETEKLAADLAALVKVRKDIAAERAALDRETAALKGERERMTLLIEERQDRQAEAEKALDGARQRAAALARQAAGLKDLIAKLEQAAAAAAAAPRENPRLAPAIAFASAKGRLRLPVNGVRLHRFGQPDGFGGVEKGLSIAARAQAQVTAPSDGWVVYAGPFRSYGQLLILNAGGGYHILLAGMERISVQLGQFVLTGEPIAIMGSGAKTAAGSTAVGTRQPVLYIEFRKDGTPVDPGPWWADTDSEKVRG